MKAMVLKGYGGVEQLELREIAEPTPGPGEVKVKVAAASINPIDWKLRSGDARAMMPLEFPAVLGRDVAGEVVEVGPGVTTLSRGDKVLGLVRRGYAEQVVASADAFARIPPGLDLHEPGGLRLLPRTHAGWVADPRVTALDTDRGPSAVRVITACASRGFFGGRRDHSLSAVNPATKAPGARPWT